jgi:hypothetical protein
MDWYNLSATTFNFAQLPDSWERSTVLVKVSLLIFHRKLNDRSTNVSAPAMGT